MSAAPAEPNVLEVKGLQTVFFTNSGLFRAVDDVCSMSARRDAGDRRRIRLRQERHRAVDHAADAGPPGKIVGGTITFKGTICSALDEAEMREIRGNDISMIFQEPMTSLNPVMRIGNQITEALRLHRHAAEGAGARRSSCCGWWASPTRSGARRNIRISFPAACASAS